MAIEIEVTQGFRDFDEFWEIQTPPFARSAQAVAKLGDAQRARLRDLLRETLVAADGTIAYSATAVAGRGGSRKHRIALAPLTYYNRDVKTMVVRLPDALAADIEAESRKRNVSKSDVVRDRLAAKPTPRPDPLADIADLIGSVKGLPSDLSRNKKKYLRAGYGRKPYR